MICRAGDGEKGGKRVAGRLDSKSGAGRWGDSCFVIAYTQKTRIKSGGVFKCRPTEAEGSNGYDYFTENNHQL